MGVVLGICLTTMIGLVVLAIQIESEEIIGAVAVGGYLLVLIVIILCGWAGNKAVKVVAGCLSHSLHASRSMDAFISYSPSVAEESVHVLADSPRLILMIATYLFMWNAVITFKKQRSKKNEEISNRGGAIFSVGPLCAHGC